MKTLAERLAWARTEKRLSQEALAKLADVSQSTIGNLESGLRLSARRITAIAQALGVNPMWLAEGIGSPEQTGTKLELVPSGPEPNVPDGAIELLVLFQQADADGKDQILDLARTIAKHGQVRWRRVANDNS